VPPVAAAAAFFVADFVAVFFAAFAVPVVVDAASSAVALFAATFALALAAEVFVAAFDATFVTAFAADVADFGDFGAARVSAGTAAVASATCSARAAFARADVFTEDPLEDVDELPVFLRAVVLVTFRPVVASATDSGFIHRPVFDCARISDIGAHPAFPNGSP